MWELIRVNRRNSILLMAVMAGCLVGLGAALGGGFAGQDGLVGGIAVALAVWAVLAMISLTAGDQILLSSSQAVPITPEIHPQLFNVVEELKIAAGLPVLPKIYMIHDPTLNAFATGRSPKSASVAITSGLLARLNRDELQGVMAHEISHIVHRDILFVTLAGVMLGSVVLLSRIFLRSTYYGSMGSRRRYSSRGSQGGAQAQAILFVIAILAAILAPILVQIFYFALSRQREYLADAGAARLTRYPEGLASALEKIAGNTAPLSTANEVTAPMYIDTPFRGGRALHLFSTHPPVEERIRILRSMSQGAALKDYVKAYRQTMGSETGLPLSVRKDTESVDLRAGSSDRSTPANEKTARRQMNDWARRASGFLFLPCSCGVTLKIPPNYSAGNVDCPRCGTRLTIPR
ncbi:MAG: M48 family metallopeptidase [Phycisphaerae bacterium]|nr:M48 family metallopeptidase [Phycisphaerae bacterium]